MDDKQEPSKEESSNSIQLSNSNSEVSISLSQELAQKISQGQSIAPISAQNTTPNSSDQDVSHTPKPSEGDPDPVQGWTCEYDSDTDQYKFELKTRAYKRNLDHDDSNPKTRDEAILVKTPTADHDVQTSRRPTLNLYECKYGYHFPTSPTASMISDLAKQVQKDTTNAPKTKPKMIGYGKSKLIITTDEDRQAKKLKEMFPTATGPIVEQMIKIYNGREGLIKAALISLGYKRAKEYDGQKEPAESPIMLMMAKPSSKKLFDKLVSYFPGKDQALIKNLMYQHKEVEYEIISKLVESQQSEADLATRGQRPSTSKKDVASKKMDKNGVIMKLRYLKFLYPSCEEIELYHLLNCNDLNAQKVMEEIEKKGHKKANIEEVLQGRKSQVQKLRAHQAAQTVTDKATQPDLVEAHKNRVKPNVDKGRVDVLKGQLKKKFEHIDDELLRRALVASDYNEPLASRFLEEREPVDDEVYKQRYKISQESEPDVVHYPCKGIQKGESSFMAISIQEHISIPRGVVECTNAVALPKVDASTFTQDDYEAIRISQRQGSKIGLASGSIYKNLIIKESLRKGRSVGLVKGTCYPEISNMKEKTVASKLANGRNIVLMSGPNYNLRLGHNPRLIERTHPFFKSVEV